jgi:uncharacterized protein (UPF0548 family)
MFLIRKPTAHILADIRDSNRDMPLSYNEVGGSRGKPPSGYVVDRNRVRLGSGRATFERARQALKSWRMLQLGWVEPCWPDARLREGELVGTLARACGLWVVNVCRIVYVKETASEVGDEFSFAYGTLKGHVERGEERFRVEWQHADDSVWYEIVAFSKPGIWLSKVGYPYVRYQQRRFARNSLQVMQNHLT